MESFFFPFFFFFASFLEELRLPRSRMCLLIMVDNILVGEKAVYIKPKIFKCVHSLQRPVEPMSVAPQQMIMKNCLSQSWTWHNGTQGALDFNALYQTQIYLFFRSEAAQGRKSHLRVTQSTRAICNHTLSKDMHNDVAHWWVSEITVFVLTGFSGSSNKPPKSVKIRPTHSSISEANQLAWRKEGKVHLALCCVHIQTRANDV